MSDVDAGARSKRSLFLRLGNGQLIKLKTVRFKDSNIIRALVQKQGDLRLKRIILAVSGPLHKMPALVGPGREGMDSRLTEIDLG